MGGGKMTEEIKKPLILDLCGGTGSWSEPYKKAGYEILNITLPKYNVNDEDVQEMCIKSNPYGILAAPPCTEFSWARTRAIAPREMDYGMKTVISCLKIIWGCQYKRQSDQKKTPPIKFWALENPYGNLLWFLGRPPFIFQPYEFGDFYSKKTCLWGYFNLPLKKETEKVIRKYEKFDLLKMDDLKEIRNISDLVWKDPKNRQELRSITPKNFANAFFEANSDEDFNYKNKIKNLKEDGSKWW